jgi:hypothetical protein
MQMEADIWPGSNRRMPCFFPSDTLEPGAIVVSGPNPLNEDAIMPGAIAVDQANW